MDTPSCRADLDDEHQLDRLSEWLSRWEPCLSVYRPRRDALLYEPEGTLYALAVGVPMTIDLFHRRRTIRKGDAIVVPRGLAMEVEPEVDLLAIRSTGTPPGHFRERFIQVWGYEHFPAGERPPEPAGAEFHEIIPASDARFAVSYAIWQRREAWATAIPRTCPDDVVILLNLEKEPAHIEIEDSSGCVELPERHVLGVSPGVGHCLRSSGELVSLRIVSEAVFVARDFLRRTSRGGSFTP
ncbi:MAG: hypothetical protein ACP5XB_32210 [Isosphaeraceae bacterium]